MPERKSQGHREAMGGRKQLRKKTSQCEWTARYKLEDYKGEAYNEKVHRETCPGGIMKMRRGNHLNELV